MTPSDAVKLIETFTPAEFKLKMVEILEWQVLHKKSLVRFGWYLKRLQYGREPRVKKTPESQANRERIEAILKGIGK
jgi:hypothetical protein